MGGGGSREPGDDSTHIEQSDLDRLPYDLRQKLQTYDEEQKSAWEKFKIEHEQRNFELDNELSSCSKKLEVESKAAAEYHSRLTEIEKRYNDSAERARNLQENQFDIDKQSHDLKQQVSQYQSEKEELAGLVEKREREVERLNEEWQRQSQKMVESNRARVEALTRADESQSECTTAKHRESRLRQEKEKLDREFEWLKKEVNDKTNGLLLAKKEQSSKSMELQVQLDEKSEEVIHFADLITMLRDTGESQTHKMETYMERLKEARDSESQMEERYRNELMAQSRLVNIYKDESENREIKIGELTRAVEELQQLVTQAHSATEDLEGTHLEEINKYQDGLKVKDDRIGGLEQELEHANELLDSMKRKGVVPVTDESVEELSPAAAAASRLLKSGMSLTQIYTEYVQVSEALHLEKQETLQLNEYLSQILQEIEEKAPLMKKQREDYERSLDTINQLTQQLDAAMQDIDKLRITGDEHGRRCGELTRENLRFKQQCADLSQQVCLLLKELEEARGTVVTQDPNISSTQSQSESQSLISQQLVSFKSIEDLQSQNQRLLAVVRELSEKQEAAELERSDTKVADLKRQLEAAALEVEEMKSGRERQATMVESIVRQRDMYRALVGQAGSSPVAMSPGGMSTPGSARPTPATPSPAAPGRERVTSPTSPLLEQREHKLLEEARATLKELQEEFAMYRREKAENEKLLNEQVDKYRKEASEHRVTNARLSSQLDFSGERFKVLQGNVESYKKEIVALQNKSQKLSTSNAKLEQNSVNLTQDLLTTKEQLVRAEVEASNLKEENTTLQSIEARVTQEKEAMEREFRSRDMLMANLQSIQNNLERNEFEMNTRMHNRIESLEKDNIQLRHKVDNYETQKLSIVNTYERQLNTSRGNVEKEKSLHSASRELLEQANKQLTTLKQDLSTVEARVAAAKTQGGTPPMPATSQVVPAKDEEELKDLKAKVVFHEREITNVREQRDAALKCVQQLKEIAHSVEQQLKEQNETGKAYQESMEKQLKETSEAASLSTQRVTELEEQVGELEKKRDTLQEVATMQSKLGEEAEADLRKKCESLKIELEQALQRTQVAVETEATIRADGEEQVSRATDAEQKYQREMILHAADIEALNSTKEQLVGFTEKLNAAEELAREAQDGLNAAQLKWDQHEKLLKEDHQRMETRCTELRQQNDILTTQLETLSNQMVRLQTSQERHLVAAKDMAESVMHDDTDKSVEQLLEVIKFQRREKEIAEARLEVVEAEASRLQQKSEHVTNQLTDTSTQLTEERKKVQVNLQTGAQHAELLRKVETLNLLQDSNRHLRGEKDRQAANITELQAKVTSLENQLTPLQTEHREFQTRWDSAKVENTLLQGEIQRWKARTNHLIEQCNKVDPEELKRSIADREVLKKQNAQLQEDFTKSKAEHSRSTQMLTQAQTELRSLKQQLIKLNQDHEKQKSALEEKDKENEEKTKTILQLRKVGRKYKTQAEELEKRMEEMRAAELTIPKVNIPELEEKLKKAETDLATITEKLGSAEYEKTQAEKSLKDEESKSKELNEKIETLTKEVKELQEKMARHVEEGKESDKKQARSSQILQTARNKLASQKEEVEKQKAEINDHKSHIAKAQGEMETQRSQFEARVHKLEQELQAARAVPAVPVTSPADLQQLTHLKEEVTRLQRENEELLDKIHQLQKQIETQAKSQPSSSGPVAKLDRTGSGGDAPKTANIRPIATQSVQGARHVAAGRSSSAETRAMASIRPMAVTPSQTPTATVMPTTVTVQDVPEGPSSSSTVTTQAQVVAPTPQTQVATAIPQQITPQIRPTQQVQPVSSHIVEEVAEMSPPTAPSIPQESVEPQTVEATPEPAPAPVPETRTEEEASVTQSRLAVPEAMVAPSTSVEPPSEDRQEVAPAHPPASSVTKRQRSETEVVEETEEETPAVKRTRLQEQHVEQVAVADINESEEDIFAPIAATAPQTEAVAEDTLVLSGDQTTQEQTEVAPPIEQTVAHVEPTSHSVEGTVPQPEEGATLQEQEEPQEPEEEPEPVTEVVVPVPRQRSVPPRAAAAPADAGGAIEISDDDDDEEEDYDEEEGEIYPEDYDEEAYAVGEEDEDEEMDDYEEEEGEVMQADGGNTDDDIIVVDDNNEADMEEQESQDRPAAGTSVVAPVSQAVPVQRTQPPTSLARIPSQPAVGRGGQQPPAFMLAAEAGFDGDDGIVPSTPTLLVPRRNDDFAQAVSSPQVQRGGRFLFGSSATEGASFQDFGRLEHQGALGMDDTRMDLSQFDDSTGRSVPTTPLSRTPPSISITPSSPPQDPLPQSTSPTPNPTPARSPTPQDGATEEVAASEAADPAVGSSKQGSQESQDAEQGDGSVAVETETGGEEEEDGGASTSDALDKSDGTGRPKKAPIQRITWDARSGPNPAAAIATTTPTPQPQQPVQPVGPRHPSPQRGDFQGRGSGTGRMYPGRGAYRSRGRGPRTQSPSQQQQQQQQQQQFGQPQGQMHHQGQPRHQGPPHPQGQQQQQNFATRGRGLRGNLRGSQFKQHRQQPF